MYPVASTSASNGRKVWAKGRLIMTVIGGVIVILLGVMFGTFKTPAEIIKFVQSKQTLKYIEQGVRMIRGLPRVP